MSERRRYGRFEIRPAERQVLVDGRPVPLGARAFDVLALLSEHRHRVVGKDELLERVWPGLVVEENNIQVQVSALRKLLGAPAITTVPGRGYQFTFAPDDASPGTSDGASGGATDGASDGAVGGSFRGSPHSSSGEATAAAAASPSDEAGALLGRAADLERLEAALAAHRLVTIAGPGGIGKTRLARELARRLATRHADGVGWVDLGALSSGAALAPAIAAAARVPLGGGDAAALLARAIAHRRMLLVLDNAEPFVAELAALVAPLLAAAPGVHLLATSQAPLHLHDEQVHRLDALAVPQVGATLAEARRHAGVQLLEQRARAVDQRFALGEETVAAAIELVRHLDGLPLAIEMAAARLPLLGLGALNDRLGDRLRLLRGTSRDAPARQQTLRATLDCSHSLLGAAEQVVLRRLAVFVGSFTLETARQVVGEGTAGVPLDEWAVIEAVAGLAAKSVLQVLPPAGASTASRYRLPESVRLYAGERLAEAGERAAAEVRHGEALARLAGLASRACDELTDADWSRRFDADGPDLNLALERAVRRQDVAAAAVLAWTAEHIDTLRGVASRRRLHREMLLPLLPLAEGETRAALLATFIGQDAVPGLSRLEAARELVALRRRGADERALYRALADLAVECARTGDVAGSDQALAEAATRESPAWPPRVRWRLAERRKTVAAMRRDPDGHRRHARVALALAEESGADRWAAEARVNLADAALMAGDLEEAIALGERAVAELRALEWPSLLAVAASNLCAAWLAADRPQEARAAAAEAVPLVWQHAPPAYFSSHLALLGALGGQAVEAMQLLGFGDAYYEAHREVRQLNEERLTQRAASLLLDALGADEAARQRGLGRRLDAAAALLLARRIVGLPAQGAAAA